MKPWVLLEKLLDGKHTITVLFVWMLTDAIPNVGVPNVEFEYFVDGILHDSNFSSAIIAVPKSTTTERKKCSSVFTPTVRATKIQQVRLVDNV